MNSYNNAFYRLQKYFSCIQALPPYNDGEVRITITNLAQCTDIPLKVVSSDILFLCQKLTATYFDYDDSAIYEYLEESGYSNISAYLDLAVDFNSPDSFKASEVYSQEVFLKIYNEITNLIYEAIAKGNLNDLHIYFCIYSSSNTLAISYDENEMVALNNFLSQNKMNPQTIDKPKFHIKESYYSLRNSDITAKVSKILDAMDKKRDIQISYRTSSQGKIEWLQITPLRLLYDATRNMYAVATIIQNEVAVFHLHNIGKITLAPSSTRLAIQEQSALDKAPHVWGMDFSSDYHWVKIKILKSNQVIDKIRRDLSYREVDFFDSKKPVEKLEKLHNYTLGQTIPNGIIYEENDNYYYEDIVWGMSAFTSWVLSYGSSMIVLAPSELRQQILEDVKKREKYYL